MLNRFSCRQCARQRRCRGGSDHWIATPLISKCLWRIMHCNRLEGISFPSIKSAKLGLANSRGILQHGIEHRL